MVSGSTGRGAIEELTLTDLTIASATRIEADLVEFPLSESDIACECMLCDMPDGHDQMEVCWRLVFEFNRPPAVEHGRDVMLLCGHCLNEWVSDPDFYGGDVVRFHPI